MNYYRVAIEVEHDDSDNEILYSFFRATDKDHAGDQARAFADRDFPFNKVRVISVIDQVTGK